MTCKNLPSGSKVVSSTKLKEGRARDKVAMVTKTRQMKRPQLTMVTVPIPGPVPYLHVDGNPICTLLQGPWATCNAFSPRGAQEPGRCCGLLRLLLLLLSLLLLRPPLKENQPDSVSPPRASQLKPRWDKNRFSASQYIRKHIFSHYRKSLPSSPQRPRCFQRRPQTGVNQSFQKAYF